MYNFFKNLQVLQKSSSPPKIFKSLKNLQVPQKLLSSANSHEE